MRFIELTSQQYNRDTNKYEPHGKFLMDMETQWEIHDRGDSPACWVNNSMGMNKEVNETYAEIKAKFSRAKLILDMDAIVPQTGMKLTIKNIHGPTEVLGKFEPVETVIDRKVYLNDQEVPQPLATIILIGLDVATEQYMDVIKMLMAQDMLERK